MSTPYAVPLALVVALGGLAWAVGGEEEPARKPVASVETIARRVERLRGLDFREIPVPKRVTPREAAREALEDLDRQYPVAEREADQKALEMLGLLPEGFDLRETFESVFSEQVAGYYDPRDGRLRVVGSGDGGGVLEESALAHELVHALEDQVFGIDADAAEEDDDSGAAYMALVEGTATAVMEDYMARHVSATAALGELFGSLPALRSAAKLPPFVLASLVFPYEEGARFVAELRRLGRGSWRLVDLALRLRPPASTEQVMHPEKWVAVEQPMRVSVPYPGTGWRELTSGTLGEWATGQLVGDAQAAAGWGGDRYVLYGRGAERRLVVRWSWDTPRDAAEFAAAIRRRGGATVSAGRLRTTMVIAGSQ